MLKDTLVAYFYPRTPSTLHVLITQDIKMTYRISLLFCYSFYYYFHNSNSIKILIFLLVTFYYFFCRYYEAATANIWYRVASVMT